MTPDEARERRSLKRIFLKHRVTESTERKQSKIVDAFFVTEDQGIGGRDFPALSPFLCVLCDSVFLPLCLPKFLLEAE